MSMWFRMQQERETKKYEPYIAPKKPAPVETAIVNDDRPIVADIVQVGETDGTPLYVDKLNGNTYAKINGEYALIGKIEDLKGQVGSI